MWSLLLQSRWGCESVNQDRFIACALLKTLKLFPQILYWEFCPHPQALNTWLLRIFHNVLTGSFNKLVPSTTVGDGIQQ